MVRLAVRGVVLGDNESVLGAATQPETAMAVWERRIPFVLRTWSSELPADCLPHGRVLIAPWEARAAIDGIFALSGTPISRGGSAFRTDVADLVRRFAEASGRSRVDLRIEHVRHDACWKFHRDHVRLRMICTYRGPGTEYVPCTFYTEALRQQLEYGGPILAVPRFAVALFKGKTASPDGAVVHRSPPIAGLGLSRLVVCLNEPSSASPRPFSDSL